MTASDQTETGAERVNGTKVQATIVQPTSLYRIEGRCAGRNSTDLKISSSLGQQKTFKGINLPGRCRDEGDLQCVYFYKADMAAECSLRSGQKEGRRKEERRDFGEREREGKRINRGVELAGKHGQKRKEKREKWKE